jgi:hypothetical protein
MVGPRAELPPRVRFVRDLEPCAKRALRGDAHSTKVLLRLARVIAAINAGAPWRVLPEIKSGIVDPDTGRMRLRVDEHAEMGLALERVVVLAEAAPRPPPDTIATLSAAPSAPPAPA